METIFVLLPLALLIAAIAVGFFIWAARSGQFDDLDTPAVRILFDDEVPASARRGAEDGGLRRGKPAPVAVAEKAHAGSGSRGSGTGDVAGSRKPEA
jgi:cbb3-type cytochrome oxidase maturation protein